MSNKKKEKEPFILKQYIVKKSKKTFFNNHDLNELAVAMTPGQDLCIDDLEVKFQKTLDRVKYHRERIGVMVAFVQPIHKVISIGYSVVNRAKLDVFDHTQWGGPLKDGIYYEPAPALGFKIASGRAIEWIYVPQADCHKIINAIPPNCRKDIIQFIERAQRYYKDKELPVWAQSLLAVEHMRIQSKVKLKLDSIDEELEKLHTEVKQPDDEITILVNRPVS